MNSLRWVLFATFAAALAGCHRTPPSADAPEPKVTNDRITFPANSRALSTIKTAPVQMGAPVRSRLNGRLVWNDDRTVRVFAPFGGRVEKILADLAQPVTAGETLALIASPDYAQAQADAGKAAADAALAERNFERLRTLFEHGAAAEKDLQAAEADRARARAEQARAEATVRMRAGVNASGEPLFPLKTPVAGVVVERNVNAGQEVRSDQMLANAPQFFAPLFVVSDPTRLWIYIDATERELAGLRRGTRFVVRSSAFPARTFDGEIDWIADELDPTTRMVRVRGRVENPDRALKAEMFVTAEFERPDSAMLEAPVTAVFMKGERHFAYVEEQAGVYVRREVQIGAQQDDQVEISSGLRAGERVVTQGALLLDEVMADAGGA